MEDYIYNSLSMNKTEEGQKCITYCDSKDSLILHPVDLSLINVPGNYYCATPYYRVNNKLQKIGKCKNTTKTIFPFLSYFTLEGHVTNNYFMENIYKITTWENLLEWLKNNSTKNIFTKSRVVENFIEYNALHSNDELNLAATNSNFINVMKDIIEKIMEPKIVNYLNERHNDKSLKIIKKKVKNNLYDESKLKNFLLQYFENVKNKVYIGDDLTKLHLSNFLEFKLDISKKEEISFIKPIDHLSEKLAIYIEDNHLN
jgi:hypothetical protein